MNIAYPGERIIRTRQVSSSSQLLEPVRKFKLTEMKFLQRFLHEATRRTPPYAIENRDVFMRHIMTTHNSSAKRYIKRYVNYTHHFTPSVHDFLDESIRQARNAPGRYTMLIQNQNDPPAPGRQAICFFPPNGQHRILIDWWTSDMAADAAALAAQPYRIPA